MPSIQRAATSIADVPSSVLNRTNRYGHRAPRGGITIRGQFFRGGCFCWNAPADPAPSEEHPVTTKPARVSIGGFTYSVQPIAISSSIGSVAFSAEKLDTRSTYVVHRDIHGEVCCDCGDFVMRRAGTGTPCKHGRALIDLGLIPAATPRILPPLSLRPTPITPRQRRFVPTEEECRQAAALFA